jgi:hypothetical protein
MWREHECIVAHGRPKRSEGRGSLLRSIEHASARRSIDGGGVWQHASGQCRSSRCKRHRGNPGLLGAYCFWGRVEWARVVGHGEESGKARRRRKAKNGAAAARGLLRILSNSRRAPRRTTKKGARCLGRGSRAVTLQVPQTTRYATVLHFRRPYIKFRQHPLCKIA